MDGTLTLVDRRYRLEAHLASGAQGDVFAAFDLGLQRACCVKMVRTGHAKARSALHKEGVALAAIRHPNVVGAFASGEHEGRPYLVVERVRGASLAEILRDYVDRQAAFPLKRALRIVTDVALGLSAVHAVGFTHRDIKPSNVMIEEQSGRVVLVDLGVAHEGPNTARRAGTPPYMAPEAWGTEHRPSVATDLYALGCLAMELITGAPPYGAEGPDLRSQHELAPIPQVGSFRPEGGYLQPLFEALLAKRPGDRPPSALLVANLVEDLVRGSGPAAPPLPTTEGGSANTGGRLRVLVVDDDPVFTRMARRCAQIALFGVPMEVSRAGSVDEAIANIMGARPDLVVLDYNLPDGTGVDVLIALRSHTADRPPQVLVVSGAVGGSERWQFRALGVGDFVDKPVDFTALVAQLSRIAERKGWRPPAGDP